MQKPVKTYIKLQIEAGKATPAPPIGPALGQHGINIMSFCKDFNNKTRDKKMILPVIITVYMDKSFSFIIKTPPASILLKQAAGLSLDKKPGSGSKKPGKEKVAEITIDKIEQIAEIKKNDLNSYDVKNSIKIILGTAKSMGIEII